jgi:hypothetical protein
MPSTVWRSNRDADDTLLPVRNTAKIRWAATTLAKDPSEPLSAGLWSDVMSSITVSRPSFDHLHRLKKRWQRGLAIECALVALLVTFSTFQLLSVL